MVKYSLRTPTEKKSSIKMRINAFATRYFIPTGVTVNPKDWNKKTQRVKQTLTNAIESSIINQILDNLEIASKKTIAKFKEAQGTPTPQEFRKAFDLEYKGRPKPKEKNIPTFTQYMEVYIERYRAVKSVNTTKSITTILHKLQSYEKTSRKKITFKGINMTFYVELSTYFAGQGYRDSYFGTAIKVIKQVYREAREVDKLHTYDGANHRGFTSSSGAVDNIYLNVDELRRIYDLDLSLEAISAIYPNSRESDLIRKVRSLSIARGLFLLAANTGLRVSDLRRLRDAEISDKIRIRTLKTNKEVIIPINSMAREILDSDLDIMQPPSEQKLNDAIKELGRLSGLTDITTITRRVGNRLVVEKKERWELISNHTARRSFATNAYKAGVPTIGIMEITGHTKESTFMKYIKVKGAENADILAKHPFFK